VNIVLSPLSEFEEWKMLKNKWSVLSVLMLALICQTIDCFAKPQKSDKPATQTKAKSEPKKSKGELTFESHCSSCHINGGNAVNPQKPLAGSKYLSNYVTFKNYLKEPVGTMPHYENLISNDKLLKDLFRYVQTLKKSEGS